MSPGRRRLLLQAAALWGAAASPWTARAQPARVPLSDMHSHYGMITRTLESSGFAEELRAERVALVAWKMIADRGFTRSTGTGIVQRGEPAPGELAALFERWFGRMRAYLAQHQLLTVLTPADVDRALAGEPGVVLACEGADFLEGQVERLDAAYALGLRHLQLVHYIRTPVGDFQTEPPTHGGLSAMGRRLVAACNAKGVLVDLAHCSADAVDQALEISRAPMVWSHGWVDGDGGNWQDPFGFLKRRLSLAQARKIAARGGVVGLWGLGLRQPGLQNWSVTPGNTRSYAREIVKLVDLIGADHVAFGTDIEGVGPQWAINGYGHLRSVVEHLQDAKLEASVVEKVACGNYARVLKQAMVPAA